MEYNRNELQNILQMSQAELKEYLNTYLQDVGYEPVCKRGFLYARGSIPVLLVAHLDTVHRDRADRVHCKHDKKIARVINEKPIDMLS